VVEIRSVLAAPFAYYTVAEFQFFATPTAVHIDT